MSLVWFIETTTSIQKAKISKVDLIINQYEKAICIILEFVVVNNDLMRPC